MFDIRESAYTHRYRLLTAFLTICDAVDWIDERRHDRECEHADWKWAYGRN